MERSDNGLFQQYVGWGLTLSLLIHLFALSSSQVAWTPQAEAFEVMEVSLAPPELRMQPEQIVSPPEESQNVEEPPEARFRAERASVAPREQVKRGDGPDAGPAVKAERAPTQPRTAPKPPARSGGGEKLQLKLSSEDLLTEIAKTEQQARNSQTETARALGSYEPFSRPLGSGARFLGVRGTNDYLPNLPDGDVTLLNAKADKYAVFVRRIAVQVFSELRSSGWESLSAGEVRSAPDFATVIGVMDTTGTFLRAYIEGSSGSSRFDELLRRAAEKGTADKNPPAGATAPDGKIYFIFQARSWTRGSINTRTGAPTERRWLLLGTGLR